MKTALDQTALDQLFREAHTFNKFTDQAVSEQTVRELYELLKWGPTSMNAQPGRYVFLHSPAARERLIPRVYQLRRRFPRFVMPGGLIDRHLAPRHFDGGKLCGFRRKGGATANLPWGSCVRLLDEKRPELGAGLMVAPLDGLLRERRNCELLVDWSGRGQVEAYMVNKRLRRALRREGMDELSFSPHQLRHSFCTNLLDVGVPLLSVSRLANHSSVTVTQRYLATAEDPLFDLLEGAE